MAGGKRVDLATLAGPSAPAKVPGFVKAAPARAVRISDLAPNPLNARVVTDDDAVEMAASLTAHGQLQACVVVTRAAFARIFPERVDEVGGAGYVQVTGGRRLAGARHAGRPSLEVQVKDELAGDRLTFLGATAAENLDRRNLDPIAEARQIASMLTDGGATQEQVAVKLGRTAAWVTQRLHLLNLLPQLQQLLVDKQLPIHVAREIGRLPQDQQLAAYERAQHPEPSDDEDTGSGDTGSGDGAGQPRQSARPRTPGVVSAIKRLGGDGRSVATHLAEHLPQAELRELLDALHEHLLRVRGEGS